MVPRVDDQRIRVQKLVDVVQCFADIDKARLS